MSVAYDYADARPPMATLVAHGALFVARYVKLPNTSSYDLGLAERDEIHSAGMGLLYNAEQAANSFIVESRAWCTDYGKYVADRLGGYFGVPADSGVAVLASVDTVVSSNAVLATVIGNLAAFKVGLGDGYGVHAYAQISVIDAMIREGISEPTSKHWLPGSTSWSGYSMNSLAYRGYGNAGLVQVVGSDIPGTDLNYITNLNGLGVHWPNGSPYAGTTNGDTDPMFDATALGLLQTATNNSCPFMLYQETTSRATYAARDGIFWHIPDPAYLGLMQHLGLVPAAPITYQGDNITGFLAAIFRRVPLPSADPSAQWVTASVTLGETDLDRIAAAIPAADISQFTNAVAGMLTGATLTGTINPKG